MTKKSNNLQVKVDDDMILWLSILKNKYHIKTGDFIRNAIVEKMKRDISTLRLKKQSEDNFCPF